MNEKKIAFHKVGFDTRRFLDQLDPVQIKAIYSETEPAALRQELILSQRLEHYRTCQAIKEWLITLQ